MAVQNQLAKIMPSAWDANSTQHYSKLTDAVNSLLGFNGPAVISNILDVQGNPVQNVAAPTAATDALNLGTAEAKYSPAVVGPQLDVGGSTPMKGLTYLYQWRQGINAWQGKGLSVTVTTAKLTAGGTNGSLVFTNGLLTAVTPAT
jgi:hypothetical protein